MVTKWSTTSKMDDLLMAATEIAVTAALPRRVKSTRTLDARNALARAYKTMILKQSAIVHKDKRGRKRSKKCIK